MEYTKGGTAGGWVFIMKGNMPIALVHPSHVDKFIAAPDMYEALKNIVNIIGNVHMGNDGGHLKGNLGLEYLWIKQAIAKAEGNS